MFLAMAAYPTPLNFALLSPRLPLWQVARNHGSHGEPRDGEQVLESQMDGGGREGMKSPREG